LVFEVPVDQRGRLEAGALGDAFDAGAAEAALGHDVDGGIKNLRATATFLQARVGCRLIDHSIQCTIQLMAPSTPR